MKKAKLLILFMSIFIASCSKSDDLDSNAELPVLTTLEVTNITGTSASTGGKVTNDGGTAIIERGVVWSKSQNPTVDDNKTTNGSGMGEFTSVLTGLTADSKYYVRAYATSSSGTSYGNQLGFDTTNGGEPGTSRKYTIDIVRNPTGESRSQPNSGGNIRCMYADGAFFDMDPDAIGYIVRFYNMVRTLDGKTSNPPSDTTYNFLADEGTEVLNGNRNNFTYTNWYNLPRGAMTRFTPQMKLFVMIGHCTTSCIDNCWVITGKVDITVLY